MLDERNLAFPLDDTLAHIHHGVKPSSGKKAYSMPRLYSKFSEIHMY